MLFRVRKIPGVSSKIYTMLRVKNTDESILEKAYIQVMCDINNCILHQAMKLNRTEFMSFFNEKLIPLIKEKFDLTLNWNDFEGRNEWVLNNEGKKKISSSCGNGADRQNEFTNKCFTVEDKAKGMSNQTVDFKFDAFNAEFTKEDFY